LAEPKKDPAASIRQRLLNLAKERGESFDLILVRYALERFLYRLGTSRHRDRFLLKGALLFLVWGMDEHRPTRDADLLGFGASDLKSLAEIVREISSMTFDDGIVYDPASVKAVEIAEDKAYAGARVTFRATLAGARIPVQVDIGFGDAVTPEPVAIEYPVLLDAPRPKLRAYPIYTVIAEKFHAMVLLGEQNSRMKDFYDLWAIARKFELDSVLIASAVAATFERRKTPLPESEPVALSRRFAESDAQKRLWQAFARRNGLPADGVTLAQAQEVISKIILPALKAARHH
jgi:predicted nucleotidyltransferase component of viral defense system